jgi:hypothetical protein
MVHHHPSSSLSSPLGIFEGTNRELYASLFQGQLLAVAFSGKLTCCGIIITIIIMSRGS